MNDREKSNRGLSAWRQMKAVVEKCRESTGKAPRLVVMPDRDVDCLLWYLGSPKSEFGGVPLVRASALGMPAVVLCRAENIGQEDEDETAGA